MVYYVTHVTRDKLINLYISSILLFHIDKSIYKSMKVCDLESLISNEVIRNRFVFFRLSKNFFFLQKQNVCHKNILYNIINDFAFTDQENTTLCSYFYKNSGEIDNAMSVLDTCQMPKEKLDFMKET